MPCDATLRKMIYVPGDLFSVNPFLNEHIPNLLARNERVIQVWYGIWHYGTDFSRCDYYRQYEYQSGWNTGPPRSAEAEVSGLIKGESAVQL